MNDAHRIPAAKILDTDVSVTELLSLARTFNPRAGLLYGLGNQSMPHHPSDLGGYGVISGQFR